MSVPESQAHLVASVSEAQARAVVIEMVHGILRNCAQTFFKELRFAEAVGLVLVVHAILVAEAKGRRATAFGLAKELEIPRTTLSRRLANLQARGLVIREGNHLFVKVEALSGPSASIEKSRQLILGAAVALPKL